MNNGLAVHKNDPYGRDYWHNNTCSSGYSFTHGPVLPTVLKEFLVHGEWRLRGEEERVWKQYSPIYVLAVPEKLVWW